MRAIGVRAPAVTALLSVPLALSLTLGAGVTPALAAGDPGAPVARSVAVAGAKDLDVTRSDTSVTYSVRVTDAEGVQGVQANAVYQAAAGTNPDSPQRMPSEFADFTRTSGTAQDGIWTGSLTLFAGTQGTWDVSVTTRDTAGNVGSFAGAELPGSAAARVTTRTTAAPAAPTGVKGKTNTQVGAMGFWWIVLFDGVVSWAPPAAGTPRPTTYKVLGANKECGSLSGDPVVWDYRGQSLRFVSRKGPTPCTVKFRLVNAFGQSPEKSVTFV